MTGDVGGCVGAFEVAFGAAEVAGVLVDVEEQVQAAVQVAGRGGQAGGDVAEDRDAGFGIGAAASPQPAAFDDPGCWWVGPGGLVAERCGVQARVQDPARAGIGTADFAGEGDERSVVAV
jgi:hypothetical protein